MGAGNLFSGKTVSYNIKECVCFSKAQIKIFCSVIIVEAAVIPNNLNTVGEWCGALAKEERSWCQ
jgi:hypothetical protein